MQAALRPFKGQRERVEVIGPAQPYYGMNEEDVVVKDLRKQKAKSLYYPILSSLSFLDKR